MEKIRIKGKDYSLPIYLPDATRAVVKSADALDLKNAQVEGVVVNTYHLMTNPGVSVLKKFGGIKKFMGFEGLVTSDSGGWQIFSLIHRSKSLGTITDKGVTFTLGAKKKTLFSPEKSIEVQFGIGSDVIICLDDFTPPDASVSQIKESVERTVLWAKKSKEHYLKLIEKNEMDKNSRPLLFSVIQGGLNKDLRKYCAEKLLEIGFDGYGFGGYVVNEEGELDLDISDYIAKLIPDKFIRFALGVGAPVEIVNCFEMGWQIFDCTLPTRDGRHKRLYNFAWEPKSLADLRNPKIHQFLYINREMYRRDTRPIGENCDCFVCQNFSRAYLHHLFNIKDTLAYRLATIHNLRTYTRLIQVLRDNTAVS
ncbi:MAG: tRNA guanosine(34) transglycosylase Tgt [Patescibacteria group bacterium]